MSTRRRAGVIVGLAGMLGGTMVALSSVEGVTAKSPSGSAGSGQAATQSPNGHGTASSTPSHRGATGTGTPVPTTMRAVAGTPASTPHSSPAASPSLKAVAPTRPTPTATASPRGQATPGGTPRSTPSSGGTTNNRNPNWRHDSTGWKSWDSSWRDPNFQRDHSRDSRHQRVEDSNRRFHDDFHFDEFRTEDRDFRSDCDTLISFHSVRALLDFLDGDSSLRDFFELHGDLYDFLVHNPDLADDFDSNCTFIDIHS